MTTNHHVVSAVALAGILVACGTPKVRYEAPTQLWLVGTWEGTITLTEGPENVVSEGPVSFTFSDSEYSVRGSKSIAPPGCGAYRVGSSLELDDQCMHTAEFDWSLILKGSFSYRWDGKTLTLEQSDPEHVRRRYIVLHRVTSEPSDARRS